MPPLVVDRFDLEDAANYPAGEFLDALDGNDGPDKHESVADADLVARIRRLVEDDFSGIVPVLTSHGVAKGHLSG